RSDDWRKIKVLNRQEGVVGGYTDPRGSRAYFGALLLGVWEDGALQYVGHVGGGFDATTLEQVAHALEPLHTDRCPLRVRPKTNERPHWVTPRLVVEVKFLEWTAEGRMRAPIYLGMRDDVDPATVSRLGGGLRPPSDARRSPTARSSLPPPKSPKRAGK